jgi:hypothetical protein
MRRKVYRELIQGTNEWLNARAGLVTASTVGKLLTSTGKVANNDTARGLTDTLVAERLTGRVEYVHPTRDMERGTILEDTSRELYAELTKTEVDQIGFARIETDTYSLGASPDGLIGPDGGWESKSPKAKTHIRTVLEDKVPPIYMPQVQACLLVFQRDWWDFTSYVPGLPLFVKRVYPDMEWRAAIITAVEKFEATAREQVERFAENTNGLPTTPYWDPFMEEEITF